MKITLNEDELAELNRQDPTTANDGGFQNFLVNLQKRAAKNNGEIVLNAADLEKIARYAFDYKNGGWQNRLLKIFGRVLGESLGR